MQEFETAYSASSDDAGKVAQVLKRLGLKIEKISLPTRSMTVSGTVAQMEAAFHPNLGIYETADKVEFRDRQSDYNIPAELQGIVTAVLGFGERRVARRKSGRAKGMQTLTAFAPADLERHYDFPPGQADGQKIAIAEFGGGYFANDLLVYCAKHGRPVPNVIAVSVNKPAFTLDQIQQLPPDQRKDELDASVEVMMDVEIIAGLCAKADIHVYFATFDQKGWVDLLNQVILDHPVVLSVSWGLAEDSSGWSKAARDAINERLNAAAVLGITVCVASGDDGSGDEENDGKAHVDFPSSSPFVLSVGGTMLTAKSTGAIEEVWWESPGRRTRRGGGSTGGGVSVFFDRPSWQGVNVVSLNGSSIDGRVIPDVAALAGDPGYDVIVFSEDAPNGGTSASAPLWTALIARVNALLPTTKRQRFLTPLLYQPGVNGQLLGPMVCKDITAGSNASHPQPGVGYKARKGFDAVAGWGTPLGTALLAGL
jgi:kumamolisin